MHNGGWKLRKRTAAGLIGMAATVLLHVLIFTVAMWGGGGRHIRAPDAVGAGANTGKADGDSIERRMYVQLNIVSDSKDPPADSIPQLTEVKPQSLLRITGPDAVRPPPLEVEKQGETAEASDADLIARTKLAGLYESQIRARIERAWIQPGESIRAPVYSCRVRISQRRDGSVEDVKLENCEGSFAWLDSLVKAIYSASPLPGPPHPDVFVDSFSMQFHSAAARAVDAVTVK